MYCDSQEAYARATLVSSVFAVPPEWQGRGEGKRMLQQVVCHLADCDEVPIYLETMGKRNVGLYSACGNFEVATHVIVCEGEEVQCDDDGGTAIMIRPVLGAKSAIKAEAAAGPKRRRALKRSRSKSKSRKLE